MICSWATTMVSDFGGWTGSGFWGERGQSKKRVVIREVVTTFERVSLNDIKRLLAGRQGFDPPDFRSMSKDGHLVSSKSLSF